AIPQGHAAFILSLEPLAAVTHGSGAGLVLLERVRLHEVPELAVAVQELQVDFEHVGGFDRVAGLERLFHHAAGLQVADLDAIEGLTLARLHELVVHDREGIAVEHDLEAALELIGTVSRHKSCALRVKKLDWRTMSS